MNKYKVGGVLVLALAFAFVLVLHAKANDKVAICHHTGSSDNPYVYMEVSFRALHGHNGHEGDLIPAPSPTCTSVVPE